VKDPNDFMTYEPGILNWPTEMVAKSDYDALAAELAERTAQRDAAGNEGMRLAADLAASKRETDEQIMMRHDGEKDYEDRIRALEAALMSLTNGFKYSTEVVTIARNALGIEITATSETKGDANA
jgi:hypothetical protein